MQLSKIQLLQQQTNHRNINELIVSLTPAVWFLKGQATTASWTDRSGNGRNMTFFNTPTIEADGSVTMDGVSQYGTTSTFTLNQPSWILWVGSQISWTANDVLFDGAGIAGGALQQTNITPNLSISAGTSACEISTVTIGSTVVLSCLFNGASSHLGRNKDAIVTGNAGTNNMGGITLGSIGGGAGLWANINTKEFIAFPFTPSTATRTQLVNELMIRHGLS